MEHQVASAAIRSGAPLVRGLGANRRRRAGAVPITGRAAQRAMCQTMAKSSKAINHSNAVKSITADVSNLVEEAEHKRELFDDPNTGTACRILWPRERQLVQTNMRASLEDELKITVFPVWL